MKAFGSFRRRLAAAAIVLTALAFPAASLAAQTVKLETSLGVANVTNGDTKYAQSVNATYDQVVKLQLYYHNTELPDSGKVAKDLTVKINIPNKAGKKQDVTSKVSAANANSVTSNATVNLDRSDAYLQYIPGSAVWKHNTGTNKDVKYVETKISDNVVTSGAGLRLEDEKPCYNFAATVTVLARVMVPGVKIVKESQVHGQTSKWSNNNTAKPADVLDYIITYQNIGNSVEKKVVIRDSLPPKLQLVSGSTKVYNTKYPSGKVVDNDNVTNSGIYIGDYNPGQTGYVTFRVKIPAESALACGKTEFRNVGVARPEGMNEYYNTAITTVTKECAEQPQYSCDAFHVTLGEKRSVTVDKFDYTAKNGATFKSVVIDWGDQTDALTTDKAVGQKHQYTKDGSYTLTATAHFMVNGKEVANSGSCSQTAEFKTPTTPTTPETPKELPNTGAGDVIGMFGAMTVAGAVAYRLFLSRRIAR